MLLENEVKVDPRRSQGDFALCMLKYGVKLNPEFVGRVFRKNNITVKKNKSKSYLKFTQSNMAYWASFVSALWGIPYYTIHYLDESSFQPRSESINNSDRCH